ncbi:hypothetical protein [Wolbachia endosymbiont of Folsomia candida]|uniref:hypothetical protein n=1 Tax=Wolbachia endosymbiont of Folsomia candida TaxID=169402 RepID=UPI000A697987|nr:hypothetical protein [Wolbachia endosymbiont of Folsomia candida]APR98640.1 hypothetical protein ASM33_05320 [Wolbachia endosymbiont of Folsomia candida]
MASLYPNREFWESSLEMHVDHWQNSFQSEEIRKNWLYSLHGRQLDVIFQYHFQDLALQKHAVQQQRKMLIDCSELLLNYYLLSHLSHSKLESAVVEVACFNLDKELIEKFLCKNNKHDKKSLIFVLFHTNPELIKDVFHFDRIQKKGFSSFILQSPPRQMKIPFKNFLSKEVVHELLQGYDTEKDDGFETELQGFFYHQDRIYVLIRRASDKDLLFNSNRIIHGYRPDWIIFDFSLHGNQVNLSAKNFNESLKIANSITSRYFETECLFASMKDHNSALLITAFLQSSIGGADPNICPFEVKFRSTHLKKDTYLVMVTNPVNSIAQELQILKLTLQQDNSFVESIRIMFQHKKITLFFKKNQHDPNYIIVYYSEHVLNKKERESFKLLMKETYGLTILPKASCCKYSGI